MSDLIPAKIIQAFALAIAISCCGRSLSRACLSACVVPIANVPARSTTVSEQPRAHSLNVARLRWGEYLGTITAQDDAGATKAAINSFRSTLKRRRLLVRRLVVRSRA